MTKKEIMTCLVGSVELSHRQEQSTRSAILLAHKRIGLLETQLFTLMSLIRDALPTVPDGFAKLETVNDQAAAFGADWEAFEGARLKDVSELTALVEQLKEAVARMPEGE